MLTIKDIARESGYSVSTVSRVLNDRKDVSPEAKRKIEKTVAAHQFIPNSNAKHLKQSSSRNIAVLVKGSSNLLFSSIVEEIQKRIEKTNFKTCIIYVDEEDNEVKEAVKACRERKPVGIMFLGGNPEFFQEGFGQIKIPSVLVSNRGDELGFANLSSVAIDDVAAGEFAVDYLIGGGHRKIGILGGDFALSDVSRQRYKGCIHGFQKHQIKFDGKLYFEGSRFTYQGAYQAMKRLLKKAKDITVVFAMSDVMAIGAIRALLDCGKQVPEDISVMGFDGIAVGEYYNPKLTTIQQKYKVLAERSVDILLQAMGESHAPIHEIVPFHLIPGESVRSLRQDTFSKIIIE